MDLIFRRLFILCVLAIPFSDFLALAPIGELQHELSGYFLIGTMAFIVMLRFFRLSEQPLYTTQSETIEYYLLGRMFIIFMFIILISLAVNFDVILYKNFRGRYAPVKVITSLLIVLFGFAVARFTYWIISKNTKPHDWYYLFIRPTGWCMFLISGIAVLEYFSWNGGPTAGFYNNVLSYLLHPNTTGLENTSFTGGAFGWVTTEGRLRAMAFEPPALANYLGFAFIFLLGGIKLHPKSLAEHKLSKQYILLSLLAIIVLYFTESRTSFLLVASTLATLFLLRFVYFSPKFLYQPQMRYLTSFCVSAGLIGLVMLFAWNTDVVTEAVFDSKSISNLSRFASMMSGFNMFIDSPFLGKGFGQYGFHTKTFIPYWGYQSWEINAWFSDPMKVWPPAFCLYARFAAELGAFGLLYWIFLWVFIMSALTRVGIAQMKMRGAPDPWLYLLITLSACVLTSGVPSDSLRNPFIWMTLGCSCYILANNRELVRSAQEQDQEEIFTPHTNDGL